MVTRVAEYDAIHLHRPLDVFQLDLADARQGLRDFVVYLIEHLLCDRDPTRIGQWLDPRGDVYAIAPDVVPAGPDIAPVNANSNLQQSVCRSAQVASGERLLEFDRAIHRGHRADELNQKAVAYRFYLLSLMFEERGPQESAVFLEQLQRQLLVALRKRAVAHHVREHDRGELALFAAATAFAASLVVTRKTGTIGVRIYAKLVQECPAHLFRIAKTRLFRHDVNRQF